MKRKAIVVSLMLILVAGLIALAYSWHKHFDASEDLKFTSCENHVDSNIDMACDSCAQILPLADYLEKKEIIAISDSDAKVEIKGSMIKDTVAISNEISKNDAILLAKSYIKDILDEDVLVAYDISLSSNAIKYQPKDFGKNVKVNISNLDLDVEDNLALLHIMDNGAYEILPLVSFNNNEIEFKATCFSTYILIAVESHEISFSGENNFKIYDAMDNEILNGDSIASGTNFTFKVIPNDGFVVSNIVISNYSGASSDDNYLTCVGSPFAYIGTINKVTQNLDIEITTEAIPNIITEPVTTKVEVGAQAEFTVVTENVTTYEWQYRENENDYWKSMVDAIGTVASNDGISKLTITSATADKNGYEFRCLLGNDTLDNEERISTNVVSLSIGQGTIEKTIPLIIEEPKTTKVAIGDVAELIVEAENVTTFTWQYKVSGDDYWKTIVDTVGSVTTTDGKSTLKTVAATEDMSGYEFRCLLGNDTLDDEERISTNVVSLIVANGNITVRVAYNFKVSNISFNEPNNEPNNEPTRMFRAFNLKGNDITTGTETQEEGDFNFTVVPEDGYGISDISLTSTETSNEYNDLELTGTIFGMAGRVTNVSGDINVIVETSSLPTITLEPVSQKVTNGNLISYSVSAENATTYTWQYRENINEYWKDCEGFIGTSRIENGISYLDIMPATYLMNGFEFRCLVGNDTFTDQNRVISNTASLIIAQDEIVVAEPPVIIVQPESQKVEVGAEFAEYTITAVGKNLTFVWQYRESGDTYWKAINSDIGTVSYSPLNETSTKSYFRTKTATYEMSGLEFRCLVGNDFYKYDNTVKSNVVDLIVAQGAIGKDVIYKELKVNLVASSGESTNEITIAWNVESEIRYELFYVNEDNEFELLSDNAVTPFVHTGLTPNTAYEYIIYGYKEEYDTHVAKGNAIGYTAFDPIYDSIIKDTIKPVLDNASTIPASEKIGPNTEVILTFDATDINYDYLEGSLLKPEDIIVIVSGEVIDTATIELNKEMIQSGERFTAKINNITGYGEVAFRIPAGVIVDLATNANDVFDIETELTASEGEISTDAPILEPFVQSIKVTNKQVSENGISKIVYEYRESGDTDFIKFVESAEQVITITGLKSETDYEVRTILYDSLNNSKVSESAFTTTKPIEENNVTFTKNPDTWTSGDVIITIDWNDTTYTHEYSLDNAEWITAPGAETSLVFSENGSVYTRYSDAGGYGPVVEGKVDNIDKEKPRIGVIQVAAGKGNTKDLVVSNIIDFGGSGIAGYFVNTEDSVENATWTPCTYSSFTHTVTENGTYYVFVIDKAGNISETTEYTVKTITEIVDKVTVIDYDREINLKVFESVKPNITTSGEYKAVSYEIIDTAIATVNPNTGVVTGKSTGTTTLKVTFTDYDDTRNTVIEIKVNVEHANAEFIIDPTELEIVYGDNTKFISFTHSDANAVITATPTDINVVTATVNNVTDKVTFIPKNVGETDVMITAEGTPQYGPITIILRVKVTPKVINVAWGTSSFVYDGTLKTVTANVTNLVNGDTCELVYSGNEGTNAGIYIAAITGVENPNYTHVGAENLSKEWVIEKADRTITVDKEIIEMEFEEESLVTFEYTGEDVTAIVSGDAAGIAKIVGYIDRTNAGRITVGSNAAGTALITIKVPASTNYKEITKAIEVKITKNTKVELEAVGAPTELTYGDDPVRFGYNYGGDGNVSVTTGNNNIVTATLSGDKIIVTPTGAGKTTITINASETQQYIAKQLVLNVVVKPKVVELEWTNNGPFVYDKASHGVTARVTNLEGSDEIVLTYQNATAVNAGIYNAKVTALSNPNYTLDGAINNSCVWEIIKTNREITFTPIENLIYGIEGTLKFSYTGEDVTAEVAISDENVANIKSYEDGVNKGNIVITPLAAGTAIVTVTVPESNNYNAITDTYEITVIRAEVKLEVNSDKVTMVYGDLPVEIEYEYLGNGELRVESSDDNIAKATLDKDNSKIIIEAINASEGVVTIKLIATETPQFNGAEKAITVTVNPRPVVLNWSEDLFTYDGTEKTITATVTNNVLTDDVKVIAYTDNVKIEAGKYTAVATELSDTNYTLTGGTNLSHAWEIKKADRTLTIDPETLTFEYGENGEINYTYTGEDVTAIVASTKTNIATVTHTDGNNAGKITVTPVAQGETKVTISIAETANYNAIQGEATVTIKRNSTVKIETADANKTQVFTFGDAARTFEYTYDGNGEVYATNTNDTAVTVTVDKENKKVTLTPKSAGTSKVTLIAPQTEQYEASSVEINVTVNKKVVELAWDYDTFVYDTTEKTVTATVTNKVPGTTVNVTSYEGNKATIVGNYVAKALTLDNNNYTLTGAINNNHNWTITKATREITFTDIEDIVFGNDVTLKFTYTGEDDTAVVTIDSEDVAKIKSYTDGERKGDIVITPLAAGNATITVTVPATHNYFAATKSYEITVVKADGKLEVNKDKADMIYGDIVEVGYGYIGNGELRVESSNNNIAKATLDKDNKKIIIETVNAIDEIVTIKLIAPETPQYIGDEKTITVTVSPRPVILSWSDTEFVYDGREKTVTATVTNKVGTDDVKVTTYTNNVKIDAGKYRAEATALDDTNYTLIGGTNISHNWEIKKADRTLTIDPETLTFEYGENREINYTYTGIDVTGYVTSTAPNIATVSNIDGNQGGRIIVTPVAQGVTHVVIKIAETMNYNAVEGECIVTIKRNTTEKVKVTDEEKTQVFTFGDAAKTIPYTYNGNGVVYAVNENNNVVAVNVDNANKKVTFTPKNAGTSKVTLIAPQTEQYESSSVEINVTVNQRVLEFTWDKNEFVYDGTLKTVIATIVNKVPGADVNITAYEQNTATIVGDYVAKVIAIDNDNYTLTGAINNAHSWKIIKATREITFTDIEDIVYGNDVTLKFTYTGEDDTAVVTIDREDIAKIKSYIDGESKGDIVITPLAAGNAIITVTVPESHNYNEAVKTYPIKVVRADGHLEVNNNKVDMIYGDAPVQIAYEYEGNAELRVESSNNNIAKATLDKDNKKIIIEAVNASTEKVIIKLIAPETPQFIGDEKQIEVTVSPRPVILSWSDTEFVYDGTEKTVTATVTNKVGTDDVKVTAYENNVKVNAGKYTATAAVLSDTNYTLVGGTNVTHAWEIKKADRVLTIDPETLTFEYGADSEINFTYTGVDVVASVVSTNENIATVRNLDGNQGGRIIVTPVAQGVTHVVISIEETMNYNAVEGECIVTIKRNTTEKVKVAEEDKTQIFTYGDGARTFAYTYNGNGVVYATNTDENVVTVNVDTANKKITLTPKNAGTAKITLIATQTEQYESSSVEINVTVNQKVVELTWGPERLVYDGTLKTVTAVVNNKVPGTTVNVVSYEGNQAIYHGTYLAEALTLDNPNYTLEGSLTKTYEWIIEKGILGATIEMEDYVYGGIKPDPVIHGNVENGTVTYYVYSNDKTKAFNWNTITSSIGLAPGIYKMYAIVSETANYLEYETAEVEFEVIHASISVELLENGMAYDYDWTNNTILARVIVPEVVSTAKYVAYRYSGDTTYREYAVITDGVAAIAFSDEDFYHEVIFVAMDDERNLVTLENGTYMIKIDKLKPVIGKIETDPIPGEKANSKDVIVSNVVEYGQSGIAYYGISETENSDDAIWVESKANRFSYEVFDNITYYVFAKDAAGNISDITENTHVEVKNIVPKVSNASILDDIVLDVFATTIPNLVFSGEPKQIIYKIEDETIAKINSLTGTITGVASGDTVVKVDLIDYDGTVTTVSANVKVLAIDAHITLEDPGMFNLVYGDTAKSLAYTYDGNAEKDRITIVCNDPTIAELSIIDGNKITLRSIVVGNTTVTVSAPETPQYKAAILEIPVTVAPRPVMLRWSDGNFVYDGTEKTVTAVVTNIVAGDEQPILTYTDNVKIEAGNYIAEVIAVSNPNYTVVDGINVQYAWKIKQAPRTVTIPERLVLDYGQTDEIEFTYTGDDRTATVTSSTSTIVTVELVDGDNSGKVYVETVAAGTCAVRVQIPASRNYEAAEGVCEVTVRAAIPELNLDRSELEMTYGDPAIDIGYTYTGNGRMTVSSSDENVVRAEIIDGKIRITPLAATTNGPITVTVTAAPTAQYTEISKTINVVVKPKVVNVTWSENEFTYDGKEKEVFVTAVTTLLDGDSIDFMYEDNIKINAGTYTAKLIEITGVDAHNYTLNGSTTSELTWKINKANREVDAPSEVTVTYGEDKNFEYRYNGEDVNSSATNANNSIATITHVDEFKKGTVTVTPVSAGETIVTINVPASDNYNATSKTVTIKVLRAVASLEPSETELEFIYGDNNRVISFNKVGNGTVTVTSSDGSVVSGVVDNSVNTITIDPKNAGTATLTLKLSRTGQYEEVVKTISVVVKQRPVEIRWPITTFIYDGTQKTLTGTVRNVVTGDIVNITRYTGNTAKNKGTYTARVTAISNSNYTLVGGVNLSTTWEIRELIPPTITVKQGTKEIDSGTWASGDVTVSISGTEINGITISYQYSFNKEDWIHYTGPFTIREETIGRKIYARAYNSQTGVSMSLIGEYELKLDSSDPTIRVTDINTTNGVRNIISERSTVTIELTVEELFSGMNSKDFSIDDIKVIMNYKGVKREITGITKTLTANSSNATLERGLYRYTLTLSGIKGDGRLELQIPEKSIYDKATRFNKLTDINLNLNVDNTAPDLGILETSADNNGRVYGDEVDLKIEAKDESGIENYEWQYSTDGNTWTTFELDENSEEFSEVIYEIIEEGALSFRVTVTDIVGNKATSLPAKITIYQTMNRKPTIRFETTQLTPTEVKITAIVKSTKKIKSIKVNASQFETAEWEETMVQNNNELTSTVSYIATSNGVYKWTVVDDVGNVVTENINITTIDNTSVIISYKVFDVTEYTKAKIVFEGDQEMRIVSVKKPSGTTIQVVKGNEVPGMTFDTTKFRREATVTLDSFEPGTIFTFENKAFKKTTVTVMEVVETEIMFVRIAEGITLFDTLFGDTFDVNDAKQLVDKMFIKTIGIDGSIENYYGIGTSTMVASVSDQYDFVAATYLSDAMRTNTTYKMNQYGDPETLKPSIKQEATGNANYLAGNSTGIKQLNESLINVGSGIKKTFRITLRAR